jgi:uncharacterized protein YjdB
MLFVGIVVAVTACADASGPEAPEPVASVEVAAPTTGLIVGGTLQLGATARTSKGTVLNGRPIAWSSSDTAIATVSQAGLVLARAPGAVIVRAASEGRTGQATLTIAPKPVASVEILPAGEITQEVETTRALALRVRAADGEELAGRPVVWASSDESVAAVDSSGRLEARAAGSATVTATVEGKAASLSVRVVTLVARVETDPPSAAVGVGEVVQITARAFGSDDVQLNRPITWASSNPAVATVNDAGRVTGVSLGTAVITASSQGKSDTTRVSVGIWQESPLLRVGDEALPATLYISMRVIGGVSRMVRYEVTEGVYRRLSVGDRYEMRFHGWLQVEGSPQVQAALVSGGVQWYDALTGYPILFPDGSDPNHDEPQYRVLPLPDGNVGFTGRPEPGAPVVTLVFPGSAETVTR